MHKPTDEDALVEIKGQIRRWQRHLDSPVLCLEKIQDILIRWEFGDERV